MSCSFGAFLDHCCEPQFIKNHDGKRVAVVVDEAKEIHPHLASPGRPPDARRQPDPFVGRGIKGKGLAFVMHGLGGWKEQPHVIAAAEGFADVGYTVVRFDATNSCGESDGEYSRATVTQFYQDLDSVILWARTQSWYEEPFFLAGHSLGGIAVGLFAECYSSLTRGLVLMSSVVSGKLSCETKQYSGLVEEWKRTGWIQRSVRDGKVARLPWSHMEDRLQYDLLNDVGKLKMPVLQVVGSVDDSTPLAHQKILFEQIPSSRKLLEVIDGAPHTFTREGHLGQLRKIIGEWAASVV